MNLLIKDFPKELADALKIEAIENGRTLKDQIIWRLSAKYVRSGPSEDRVGAGELGKMASISVELPKSLENLKKLARVVPGNKRPTMKDVEKARATDESADKCEHRFGSVCDDCAKRRKLREI